LRLPFWIQALLVGLLVAVLALAVTDVVDNWSDWVVLGVIVFTTIAVAFTVYNRQYPTKKRSFTRDSDSKW
jgi:drug/metabolite transporter (DMT)-like permease